MTFSEAPDTVTDTVEEEYDEEGYYQMTPREMRQEQEDRDEVFNNSAEELKDILNGEWLNPIFTSSLTGNEYDFIMGFVASHLDKLRAVTYNTGAGDNTGVQGLTTAQIFYIYNDIQDLAKELALAEVKASPEYKESKATAKAINYLLHDVQSVVGKENADKPLSEKIEEYISGRGFTPESIKAELLEKVRSLNEYSTSENAELNTSRIQLLTQLYFTYSKLSRYED